MFEWLAQRLADVGISLAPGQLKTWTIILGGVGIVLMLGDGKGQLLARSHKGGRKEAKAARKLAIAQTRARVYNQVSFCLGGPLLSKRTVQKKPASTLYITDAQRGVAVVGSPNSGKTFSVIDPVIRNSIDQGFPTILYDFKYPEQSKEIAGYARKKGYEVSIFAPGFPESGRCNLLEFMKSETDGLTARQISMTLNTNLSTGKDKSSDDFFGPAGDQLVQAALMIAKSLPQPDLLTAATLLTLNRLPERILNAKECSDKGGFIGWKMSIWVYMAFAQLIQLKDSERTLGGVLGTASRLFSRFMTPELTTAFSGDSTIPLKMEGRRLLIFGLDQKRRDAVSPLLATTLHMVVTNSMYSDRNEPLTLVLDEVPTLNLPHLVRWLNELRYKGLCTVLGFQNIGQLEDAYGKGILQAIMTGCATKAIFNPQDKESARYFSDYLGEEDIKTNQKSRGYGKGGRSRNLSEQHNKRALVEAAELNRYPKGKLVFISPGYSSGHASDEEAYVPMILKAKIPKSEILKASYSKKVWRKVRDQIQQQNLDQTPVGARELQERYEFLDRMFSLSNDEQRPAVLGNTIIKNPDLLRRLVEEVF